ncbi:hypothetical protein GINT2_000284 [Glugoides intestinalis]
MTATTKPFDNISGELTLKDLLLTSFSGSLFNTAMFTVAPIFIFLAIIWLYYRNYYFKALGIMKTMGLLVSSGILFGVTFKVLLTIAQLFVEFPENIPYSFLEIILGLLVPCFILVMCLYLLFAKRLHESIGLIPKQATATVGPPQVATDEPVATDELPPVGPPQDALNAQVEPVATDELPPVEPVEPTSQALRDTQIDIAQAVRDALNVKAQVATVGPPQAATNAQAAKAALAKAQAALDQAMGDERAAKDAQAALKRAVRAVRAAKAQHFLEPAARDAQDVLAQAKAVLKQAIRNAIAQHFLEPAAQAVRDARAALAQAKAVLDQAIRDAIAQDFLEQAKQAVRDAQDVLDQAKDVLDQAMEDDRARKDAKAVLDA